jgi:hypothetical protein
MNEIKERLGLALGTCVLLAGAWACTATRHANGSVTLKFAPDMTVRAWGLEDALEGLTDLLAACMNGTFPRPCTDAERADIIDVIEDVLDRKREIDRPVRDAFV